MHRARSRVLAALVLAAVVPLLLVAGIAYVQWPRGTVPDSVAVLPFFNTTGDAELDYLSEGITDGLINSLSQISSLRVTPRALVARYANERADMETIARSLDVRAVVTGRITQSDDTVTVAIELVDVEELSQLWGAQYRSSLVGVMDVERTIAVELAGRLQPGESRAEPTRLTRQYAQVPEAYQAYLKGRHYLKMRTAQGYSSAIEYFEQAAATDPSYALAYTGLAEAFATLGYFNVLPSNVAFPKAKAAALRALQLDDELAEAHSSLAAVLLLYEWNFPSAEQRYKVSLGLNHMVPEPVMGYSIVSRVPGTPSGSDRRGHSSRATRSRRTTNHAAYRVDLLLRSSVRPRHRAGAENARVEPDLSACVRAPDRGVVGEGPGRERAAGDRKTVPGRLRRDPRCGRLPGCGPRRRTGPRRRSSRRSGARRKNRRFHGS